MTPYTDTHSIHKKLYPYHKFLFEETKTKTADERISETVFYKKKKKRRNHRLFML